MGSKQIRKNSNYNSVVFCTYFDKNYLMKGLCLHASLRKHNPTAELWILCFDDYTREILTKLKLDGVKIISLIDFEDRDLLKVKNTRSLVEYYWTCTPSLPLYIFKKDPKVEKVVYLDADLFFYSKVDPVYDELEDGSIYTVEHRYPKGQEGRIKTSGRFNVAFQIFKRDKEGLTCLKRWRQQCLNWCLFRSEDNKLGDQLYLNEWPDLYKNLVISQNLGVDAAPWNIKQYKVYKQNNSVYISGDQLICYHFHQLQILSDHSFDYCTGYFLPEQVINLIYKPYIKSLKEQIERVRHIDPQFTIIPPQRTLRMTLRNLFIKRFGPIYWRIQTALLEFRWDL